LRVANLEAPGICLYTQQNVFKEIKQIEKGQPELDHALDNIYGQVTKVNEIKKHDMTLPGKWTIRHLWHLTSGCILGLLLLLEDFS